METNTANNIRHELHEYDKEIYDVKKDVSEEVSSLTSKFKLYDDIQTG